MLCVILLMLDRPLLGMSLSLVYLGVGALASWQLARRGHTLGVVVSALLGWPLFIGMLFGSDPPTLAPSDARGPLADRIDRCMASLRADLGSGLGSSTALPPELATSEQLRSLELALRGADRRLAAVDRLIAELGCEPLAGADARADAARDRTIAGSLATLNRARTHAADELEQVLSSLVQLRVQLGVHTLIGSAAVEPVRERLSELEARVAALAEISSLAHEPACTDPGERHDLVRESC